MADELSTTITNSQPQPQTTHLNYQQAVSFFRLQDFAKPTHFDVDIILPQKLAKLVTIIGTSGSDAKISGLNETVGRTSFEVTNSETKVLTKETTQIDTSSLKFTAERAELSGRTFSTTQQKIYGVTELFPIQSVYNTIDISFLVRDKNFFEKQVFDKWMDFINPVDTFDFKYKDDYRGTVKIHQYSASGDPLYDVQLFDIFPISMNQLNLDWSAQNEFHRLIITFAYTYWEPTYHDLAFPTASVGLLSQLAAYGIRAADIGYTTAQALKTGNPFIVGGVLASNLPTAGFTNFSLTSLTNSLTQNI